jgi:RHH-type proline utilization regulon transcriptional repressor/proline dehydrogenase/delta 1-pyrroline-5-carboxylate dehydrogenase
MSSANLQLLDWLAAASSAAPAISVKLSALTPRFDPIDPAGSTRRALLRLQPVLAKAAALGAAVTVDMEQHELKGLIVDAFSTMLADFTNEGWAAGDCTTSLRARHTARDHRASHPGWRAGAKERSASPSESAYWVPRLRSRVAAQLPGPGIPGQGSRPIAQYEALTALLFDNVDCHLSAIAGHNLRSLSHAFAAAQRAGSRPSAGKCRC